MGLGKFIKGQLIDVIQFTTDNKDVLAHKFDDGGKQIMMGAQLTVRPGQKVIFVNEGEIADIFNEGRYELTTSNMPVLTKLKSWKYGFESPFKVDIYFISVDEKISQGWGTPSKIAVKDPEFGMLRIGANGLYNYKVENPKIFLEKLVGTDREYMVTECRPQLNGLFTTSFTDFFGESKITLFDAYGNVNEFSEAVLQEVKPKFDEFGLSLISFNIREIRVPESVESAMDERASIAALGGMDMYQRKTMTDATAEAAVNMAQREGGGTANFGMEMATGMAMGGMMGNMMGGAMAGSASGISQAAGQNTSGNQPAMKACPHCGNGVPEGAKFCPHCGKSTAPEGDQCVKCHGEIPKGAKFCPLCGAKQEVAKSFCSECGGEVAPGAKFCPHCGNKQ